MTRRKTLTDDWRKRREPDWDDTLMRLETKLNLARCDVGNAAQIARIEDAIRRKKSKELS